MDCWDFQASLDGYMVRPCLKQNKTSKLSIMVPSTVRNPTIPPMDLASI